MKKLITISSRTILIIIILILNIFNSPKAFSELKLLEDYPNNATLPHHFRKSTDYIYKSIDKNINLTGLDKLNISGSGQFSDSGLSLIKESIPNNFNILNIDLRQESHGFIDGIAVSFENSKNNANKGLNLSEVLTVENNLLNSIKIGDPIPFYNTKEIIVPKKVENELEVSISKKISYIRIPVTDGGIPTDDMINYFINIINKHPKNTWFHFHCKEGIGRTTTFMIMYDITKNYKDVSLNDIIKRQIILSNINEGDAEDFYSGKHNKFLIKFYNEYTSSNFKKEAI